jgi:Flp pilus assembly pilin Flp
MSLTHRLPWIKNRQGAALTEYGLLVGLIAAVAIGTVGGLGRQVDQGFTSASTEMATVLNGSAGTADGPAEEQAPARHEAMVFDMVAASNPPRTGYYGRLNEGSATVHKNELPTLKGLYYYNGSGAAFVLNANSALDLTGYSLSCDGAGFNGEIWDIPGQGSYHAGTTSSSHYWTNGGGPRFQPGPYSCVVYAPEG